MFFDFDPDASSAASCARNGVREFMIYFFDVLPFFGRLTYSPFGRKRRAAYRAASLISVVHLCLLLMFMPGVAYILFSKQECPI